MKGVDINVYDFDFDLTFAVLLMNADGTIYHRYGGRDWTDPQSHLSVASLVDVLEKTLPDHASYAKKPSPPKKRRAVSVDRMPAMLRKKRQPNCYHCHMVHDAMTEERQQRKVFKRSDVWRYPDPHELGFQVERDDQVRIKEVVPTSAAAKAGLKEGARIYTIAGKRVLSLADVMRALHEARSGPGRLEVTFWQDGEERTGAFPLRKGWKEPVPLNFSWRASKWKLSPKPGFGGQQLKPAQLAKLGLDEEAFAFRVGYVVTWGPARHTGQNAIRAGIRKGDVILSFDGDNEFESVDHWHAWFRLRKKAGEKIKVTLLRGGKRKTITLPVVD